MSVVKKPVSFVEIDEGSCGQRLDNFLIKHLKSVPNSRIYQMIRKGEVRVNKKRARQTCRLSVGDMVRIPPVVISDEPEPIRVRAADRALLSQVCYEDDQLVVLNKPAGLACHGGTGIRYGVVEAWRAMHPDCRFIELAHRLDRDTSGCLLLAKKRSVLRALHSQFRENQVQKVYHAMVIGQWPKATKRVDAPLLKQIHASGEHRVKVDDRGKPSLTNFQVLSSYPGHTLVCARPKTGRTHQIRVHCAHAGCPIVGDEKYAKRADDCTGGRFGMALHAAQLRFDHPKSGELVVDAPYGQAFEDLKAFVSAR